MTLRVLLIFSLFLTGLFMSANSISAVLVLAGVLFVAANMNYLKSWSHTLLMLLTLEVLMLTNTLLLTLGVSSGLTSTETLFMLFTLAVCEASLGVAVLVCYSRSFGNDLLQSSNLL